MEIVVDLLCKPINYNIQYNHNVKYTCLYSIIVYYNKLIHIKYLCGTTNLYAQLSKM